ncbi:MAG: hypothetical protein Q7R98_03105 [Candidatus Jorgensenbacteria bacterium]|nr:hypothetical protein [Candidatus Jorgensenbacteria bacterium]
MQHIGRNIIILLVILAGIGIAVGYFLDTQKISAVDIVAQNGLHWHAKLTIIINGKEQVVPAGVGLGGAIEQPIHTHGTDDIIHMEFGGAVKKQNLALGRFFEVWEKQFNKNCIFDFCNGAKGTVTMLVNGKENNEFENYIMRDGDQIEIRYGF